MRGPLENVRAAAVEAGYENIFDYKWTGEANVGTSLQSADLFVANHSTAGDTRKGSQWVTEARHELPVGSGSELQTGEHRVELRLSPDAPPSSDSVAKWAIRAIVDRDGAAEERWQTPFQVVSAAPAIAPDELESEHVKGESCEVEIKLAAAGAPLGGTITGTLAITPRVEVPAAKIIAFLFRDRHSHPIEKTSAGRTLAWKTREVVTKKVDLPVGVTQELPFSLSLPQDAEPTATAVNSSVCWWVETLIDYGWSGPCNEPARRAVVLYSADGA